MKIDFNSGIFQNCSGDIRQGLDQDDSASRLKFFSSFFFPLAIVAVFVQDSSTCTRLAIGPVPLTGAIDNDYGKDFGARFLATFQSVYPNLRAHLRFFKAHSEVQQRLVSLSTSPLDILGAVLL